MEFKNGLTMELNEKMTRVHDLVGKHIFYKDEHNTYKGTIVGTTTYEEDADIYVTIKLKNGSAFSIPIDIAMELLDRGHHGGKIAYIEVN